MSNEMTTDNMSNEEVIEVLKGLVFGSFDRTTRKERQALDLAIKALEERPQGDLVSREALKKEFCKDIMGGLNWERIIDNAPTVTPDMAQVLAYESGKASAERPHGEWIEESTETGALGIKYTWVRCNQCGWNNSLVIPKNFCPNCGAEMKGGAK